MCEKNTFLPLYLTPWVRSRGTYARPSPGRLVHGARVVLATEPCNRRGESSTAALDPEDEPERVPAWNRLLRDVTADNPGVRLLDFGARVSPEGHFTWTAGGVQVRSDGLHLTPSGVQEWITPWLLPRLRDAVSG